jgi:hypothetical protein
MQYESKYLKYKFKYLNLCSRLQKGGDETINWPRDLNKIRVGDKLKIISIPGAVAINYGAYPYLATAGEVKSVTQNSIDLEFIRDNFFGALWGFNSAQYPRGIVFQKDNQVINSTQV